MSNKKCFSFKSFTFVWFFWSHLAVLRDDCWFCAQGQRPVETLWYLNLNVILLMKSRCSRQLTYLSSYLLFSLFLLESYFKKFLRFLFFCFGAILDCSRLITWSVLMGYSSWYFGIIYNVGVELRLMACKASALLFFSQIFYFVFFYLSYASFINEY